MDVQVTIILPTPFLPDDPGTLPPSTLGRAPIGAYFSPGTFSVFLDSGVVFSPLFTVVLVGSWVRVCQVGFLRWAYHRRRPLRGKDC